MAIQNIKCPNCGGQVQMDDTLEKGFCMYCGNAIHIKEEVAKIQIEHSGKVEVEIEINDSKRLANAILLADRAFNSGNFSECYNYCCMALECDVNNVHATFRKGLSAICLSLSRVSELEQVLQIAVNILRQNSPHPEATIHSMFREVLGFVQATHGQYIRPRNYVYPSLAAVNDTFTSLANLLRVCSTCADLITTDMMVNQPAYEADKRCCLELGLHLCEESLKTCTYFVGVRQVRRGNGYISQEVHEHAKTPYGDLVGSCQAKFKNEYNTLPSTQRALIGFDNEIALLQRDVDTFTSHLEDYFNINPTIGQEYKQNAKSFGVATAAAFGVMVLCTILSAGSPDVTLFAVILILSLLASVTLGIIAIVKAIRCSRTRKRILSQLPPELTTLRNIHDQSKAKLRSVKKDKATFVRNNIKR